MTTLKFENNKIYSTSSLCEKTDIFAIVEKIPAGYYVWNIGENMGTHEYIPVCQDLRLENKDNFEINAATLKAVKVALDEWEKLNKAASWGVGNLRQAEKALKSKRRGYIADRKRAAAEDARRITTGGGFMDGIYPKLKKEVVRMKEKILKDCTHC